MIRRIKFENFRALRDVELTLEPLTVFVGPNASGKSSVFRALSAYGVSSDDVWRHDPKLEPQVFFHSDPGSLPLARTGRAWVSHPEIDAQLVRLDLRAIRQDVPSMRVSRLSESGDNLANVIDSLPRPEQIKLAQQYCNLVPVYGDVDTAPSGTGHRVLRFFDRWSPDLTYFSQDVSDGSLLALALLTLGYQHPQPRLIAIEEPERGLHPYLMQEMTRLLRGLTVGAAPIQVLMATQSAELLEYVEPGEVRFFTKDPVDGSVKIGAVDTQAEGWEAAFEEYEHSLRDAWLSGGLGGVPGGMNGNGTSHP